MNGISIHSIHMDLARIGADIQRNSAVGGQGALEAEVRCKGKRGGTDESERGKNCGESAHIENSFDTGLWENSLPDQEEIREILANSSRNASRIYYVATSEEAMPARL
jgi:hypothetical protein